MPAKAGRGNNLMLMNSILVNRTQLLQGAAIADVPIEVLTSLEEDPKTEKAIASVDATLMQALKIGLAEMGLDKFRRSPSANKCLKKGGNSIRCEVCGRTTKQLAGGLLACAPNYGQRVVVAACPACRKKLADS